METTILGIDHGNGSIKTASSVFPCGFKKQLIHDARFQEGKISDIKCGHPLILHGSEPTLNFGLLCWGVWLVIVNDRAYTGC